MRFDILTLFPEVISAYMDSSMMKKAQENKLIEYHTHNIRDYAVDEYGHVDDILYGGGKGMLMRAEPIYEAHKFALAQDKQENRKSITLFMSPKGEVFNQDIAREIATFDQVILLCGHYEGVDQRVIDKIVDREISVGDYVLSGGELAALTVMDASSRMLDNFLANTEAMEHESHYFGTLESRQYTRPREWMGEVVPEVLFSGNHQLIEDFKYLDGLNETLEKRPDIFENLELSEEDLARLIEYRKNL